jgi:hypothetical protein
VKRLALSLLVIALLTTSASAIEIRLRDGTVLDAASYTVTGSYMMVVLANGQRLAYDVADVDLEALEAAEAAAAVAAGEPAGETAAEGPTKSDLPGDRKLSLPPEDAETSGISITDQDVRRFKPEGEEGAAGNGSGGDQPAGPPPGFQEGGGVVLNNLRVTDLGQGRWLVEGDVINRSPTMVNNVRVQLQTVAEAGSSPWASEVAVTNSLAPDGVAVFSREFSATQPEGKTHPDIRAAVYWMGPATGPPPQAPAGVAPRRPGPVPTPRV